MLQVMASYPAAIFLLALGLISGIATASDDATTSSGSSKDSGTSSPEPLLLGPGLAPIYGLVRTISDASREDASKSGAGWSKPDSTTRHWDGHTASWSSDESATADATGGASGTKARSWDQASLIQPDADDGWIVVWDDHVTDATIEGACDEAAGASSQHRFKGVCSFRYGIQPPFTGTGSSKASAADGSASGDTSSASSVPPLFYYPSARPQATGAQARGAQSANAGSASGEDGDAGFPRGVAIRMSLNELKSLLVAHQGGVRYVEWDQPMHTTALVNQTEVPNWGLDAIDSTTGERDGSYTYDDAFAGQGVNAYYVVDTGILASHVDFLLPNGTSRVHVSAEMDFINDGANGIDCEGHGTHVAGILGGSTYGVAKLVNLFALRVFGCVDGTPESIVLAALAWVVANHVKPAVVNLSLGGAPSPLSDEARLAVVQAGVTVVAAAGNSAKDACPFHSRSSIIVGAVNSAQPMQLAVYSNYGPCIDILAPGDGIQAPTVNPRDPYDTEYTKYLSGTSMASPHVQVRESVVVNAATPGIIANLRTDTINTFLYSLPIYVSVTPRWLVATKGTSVLVTVALSMAPTATVTISGFPLANTPPGRVVVTDDPLTFTTENWDSPQPLNFSFPPDGLVGYQEYAYIFSAVSGDPQFNGRSVRVGILREDSCSLCGQGFEHPIDIPSLPFSTVYSNFDSGDWHTCGGSRGNDVTYAYTPLQNVVVSITTCAPQTKFDTVLAVYRGPWVMSTLCNNDCRYSEDGWCDDGGPNSNFADCELGTDCTDCGSREKMEAEFLYCQDDYTCPYSGSLSTIKMLRMQAGTTYFVVVDSFYSGDIGKGWYRLGVEEFGLSNPSCNFTADSAILPDDDGVCASDYWVDAQISLINALLQSPDAQSVVSTFLNTNVAFVEGISIQAKAGSSLAGCPSGASSAPPEKATCLTGQAIQAGIEVSMSDCISTQVNLAALADEVAAFLDQSIPRCSIDLSVRPGPDSSSRRHLLDTGISTFNLMLQIYVDGGAPGENVRDTVNSAGFREFLVSYLTVFVGTVRSMGAIAAELVPLSSVTSDPHFVTSRGQKFDFNGEADRTYCIITDEHLHVNAHFMGAAKPADTPMAASPAGGGPDTRTWMDQVAILVGGDTVLVGAESPMGTGYALAYGTLLVNGVRKNDQVSACCQVLACDQGLAAESNVSLSFSSSFN
eukprot:jgi/Mesvir1/8211/Mv12502-RA.1